MKNRQRNLRKVFRLLHGKNTRCVNDSIHRAALSLLRNYDVIFLPKFSSTQMVRRGLHSLLFGLPSQINPSSFASLCLKTLLPFYFTLCLFYLILFYYPSHSLFITQTIAKLHYITYIILHHRTSSQDQSLSRSRHADVEPVRLSTIWTTRFFSLPCFFFSL